MKKKQKNSAFSEVKKRVKSRLTRFLRRLNLETASFCVKKQHLAMSKTRDFAVDSVSSFLGLSSPQGIPLARRQSKISLS